MFYRSRRRLMMLPLAPPLTLRQRCRHFATRYAATPRYLLRRQLLRRYGHIGGHVVTLLLDATPLRALTTLHYV